MDCRFSALDGGWEWERRGEKRRRAYWGVRTGKGGL